MTKCATALPIAVFLGTCLLTPFDTALSGPIIGPNTENTHRLARQDSSQKVKKAKKSPKGAFFRSIAFPGWGQWYNEQKIKAVVVFSAEAFLIGLSIYYNRKAGQSIEGSVEEEVWSDRRNGAYWYLLGAALISGIDAFIDAHLYDFDTGPDLALQMGLIRAEPVSRQGPILGLSFLANF